MLIFINTIMVKNKTFHTQQDTCCWMYTML